MIRYYSINTDSAKLESAKPLPLKIEPEDSVVSSVMEEPELQRVWPDRPTVYPSGEKIPDSLPNSYLPSQSCGNCAAYDIKTTICLKYDAPVLRSYWCRSWRAK